MLYLPY